MIVSAALLVVLTMSAVWAADNTCSECGMTVDADSRFSSKIAGDGKALFFCDIGDMFSYLGRKNRNASGAAVRDYGTGEWVAAEKAYYVHSEKKFKTPMGWGVAAFQDRDRAAGFGKVMDFEAAAEALK
jgi:nitrous oxide reductase accessory protein NosL